MASVKKETTLPVRVDATTHKRLKSLAVEHAVSMSSLAISAINWMLAREGK